MKTILDAINESKQDEQKLIDFAGNSLAKRFLIIKNRLKSPENDIYYWLKKDVVELEYKVNEIENAISKTKQKEIEKTEGAELVVEENGWKVYRIDTYEASCLYGKSTKWCVASTETREHFDDYKDKGVVLYYFIRNNEKYALALYPKIAGDFNRYGIRANYELYDEKDKLIIEIQKIKQLNLPKIPGVDLILEVSPNKIEGDVLVKVYPNNQGEFVIPDGIKTIGDFAFDNCTSLTSITIPSSVTSIGDFAFSYCKSLTSITIPNNVTSIGNAAFYFCESLTSITIPNNVISIGESAFSNCTSLTSIIIPDGVTTIGEWAFYGCLNLTIYAEAPSKPTGWNADWNPGNRPVVWNYKNSTRSNNINESKQDEQKLIDFAGNSLAKRFLSIKNKLKSPENDIYFWLKKDKTELEDRVNEIENTTSKTKQKEIEKTEGAELVVEENGWKVYRIDTYEASCLYGKSTKWCVASTETSDHFDDYKDKGVKLYYFIKNNEKYALALYPQIIVSEGDGIKSNFELYDATDTLITDQKEIEKLNLPKIPGVKLTFEILPNKIENGVLIKVYPHNQREFVIPNNIISIGKSAFSGLASLKSITIPSSVTSIGDYAFSDCSSLTSITIPNSVTTIGNCAFYACDSLTSITIPNSVTKIGDFAFMNCTSLTSISISDNVTSISDQAFMNCRSLTSIAIPSNVTSIGISAFSYCISLTSITIPNSVIKIGDYAFTNCSSLTSISISDNVTTIGNCAFRRCSSLESITIPNNVTSIGDYAFSGCKSLTSITIPNNVTSIGGNAFYDCDSLASVTIPNSVTKIGDAAFAYCDSLVSVTIPNSVIKIGDYAFSGCGSLTIYAEATNKPSGWDAKWNSNNRPVVWNYKNSTSSNNINESKVDDEYNKFWSMIDRDIFNNIVLADPKTSSDADEIKMIGFVAKQLLLPKYKDGDTEFVKDLDRVKKAIEKYQLNPGNYLKLPSFKTVDEFVKYMENPDVVAIEAPVKEIDALTKIYNEYYSDIAREDFDKIIAMDPKTTDKSIGEIAKNMLLISFRKKEDILNNAKEISAACKSYYEMKDKLPTDKQQLSAYKTTKEFVDYITEGPESSLVAELKRNETVDPTTKRKVKDDFKVIASTFDYDIIEPKSHSASIAVGGGYRSPNGMQWCTGWEPDKDSQNDGNWKSYTERGGRLFCFMHKARYRGSANRIVNWQIQIRDNQIGEFLNGDDRADYPGATKAERFKNFLRAHTDIFNAIKNKEPFNNIVAVKELEAEIKYVTEPFIVDSVKAIAELEVSNLANICKEVIFDIPEIPVGICASFISLNKITFKEGVKEIGDQAFMNCATLKTLVFPESLEIIGKEAFQNCLELKGSIRIPDNVKEIRTRAFSQDKCKLKVNKDRKIKIKFDELDREWVSTHVQTITIN